MNKNISTKTTLSSLRFCVMAVLLFIVTSASAYDFYDNESGLYYNILSSSEKTVEVTFGGPQYEVTDSYVGDIVIPETVSYGSTLYSVTSIGDSAFYYCSGLKSVYSYNFDPPPSCGDTVFHFYDNVSTNTCALYVPTGSKDKYSTADQWKDFFIIYDELDGIESVSVDNTEVVGYYTMDGKAVDAPQRGVNIVRYSDGTTKKVLVK